MEIDLTEDGVLGYLRRDRISWFLHTLMSMPWEFENTKPISSDEQLTGWKHIGDKYHLACDRCGKRLSEDLPWEKTYGGLCKSCNDIVEKDMHEHEIAFNNWHIIKGENKSKIRNAYNRVFLTELMDERRR